MTVIASFWMESEPFMISDLLISIERPPALTRVGQLPRPIEKFNLRLPRDSSRYTIVDVRQKSVRICDRFVISYAGKLSEADTLIGDLRDAAKMGPITGKLFESRIVALQRESRITDLSVLALIEERGRIYSGGHRCHLLRSQKFRHLRACGSGNQDILDVFGGYRGKETNRVLSPREEGLGLSLGLSSVLLGKEIVTAEPLQKAYGGCYEITYWSGNDFDKLDDVVHLHWAVNYQKGRGFHFDLPVKLQKLEYHNRVLYLRDLEVSGSAVDDTVYIIKPSAENMEGDRPTQFVPSFRYKWIVNHVYVTLENGKIRYRNSVNYVHDGNYMLLIENNDNLLSVQVRPEYFDFMKEILQELEGSN